MTRAVLCLVALVMGLDGVEVARGQSCAGVVEREVVAAALFGAGDPSCDVNRDGALTAADLVAAADPPPTSTPTDSPTSTASPTATPTPTVTPTSTPSPTATATLPPCPETERGAELELVLDNDSGVATVRVELSGERLEDPCASEQRISYSAVAACGSGEEMCLAIDSLVPGLWRHTLRVPDPDLGQVQHRRTLLIGDTQPNRLHMRAFASVLVVERADNDGTGSLRRRIVEAESANKPVLIRFDPQVFPAGLPRAIRLDFALPTLAASDVTIDAIDPAGQAGNRIIDAAGLPIGALSISGARNHVIGLHLRNAGGNDRDVLNITGAEASGNLIEQVIVETAQSADGIGIDAGAGSGFDETVNVVRECEVSGAFDKGIKVTTGAHARIEDCWVHDNQNGGIQATLSGHVQAFRNRVDDNRGGSAQNGLAANGEDEEGEPSELLTRGNLARRNGANGISVRSLSEADLRDDYLAANDSSGLRVFNDVGSAASARVEGVAAVCNGVDGAVVADTSSADFGGGALDSPGDNAFTQNDLPGGGANLRNATDALVRALNNQWENCGTGEECVVEAIEALDLSDNGFQTEVAPAQAHRAQDPVVSEVTPIRGMEGELLRIFGSGFNVIDGHFAEDRCQDVAGRNRCVPLRGNCVRIGGRSAEIVAVTPTMLVVRWPFTCREPVPLTVTIDQGPTGSTSEPVTVCRAR